MTGERRPPLETVSPDDEFYWCPGSTYNHFHTNTKGVCLACDVETFNANDGTNRYQARVSWRAHQQGVRYLIEEEYEPA